jgi:succinate dehydrogenase / fumarate reductase cytochrome b subunit
MASTSQAGPAAPIPATGSSSNVRPRNFIERNHFWLRRIHSLSGIVPVGGFIIYHFYENAAILQPGGAPEKLQAYNEMAVHARNLYLFLFLEWGIIFLPLIWHALYGLVIMTYTRVNTDQYKFARNRLFMWQRITGVITLLFIFYHLWTFRFTAFADQPADPTAVAYSFGILPIFVFYIIGVAAASFHLGNGIWTFLITWGITIGRRSQRISQWVTTAISVGMTLLGIWIAVQFALLAPGGFKLWWP